MNPFKKSDPEDWGMCLVTDRSQTCGRDLVEVVEAALRGGVRAVQLREKDLETIDLYRLGGRLIAVCRAAGASLIINDRADVALALDADGVHLTGKSLPPAVVRKMLGPDKRLGISCHSLEQVRHAADSGCDYLFLGPIFRTPSKERFGAPLTPAIIPEARKLSAAPILAIGGVRACRVPELIAAGASGVAVISAVMAAFDPAAAAAEILRLASKSPSL